MSSNSLGCKSSLSSNLIFKKHHDSRLLFHITISFVKPPYNHKLTRSQNVRRILMLVTPVNVDRGLSDVTFFQFKYFLVKKLTENSVSYSEPQLCVIDMKCFSDLVQIY